MAGKNGGHGKHGGHGDHAGHGKHGDHAMKDGGCCKGMSGDDRSCKAKPDQQTDAGAAVILAQTAATPDMGASKPEEGEAA
ncbi:MAG: hypothetical protein AAF492_21090, partial [Verrucomicrobiota bacterium]